ncbi:MULTISPECIES: DUF4431 domain-containing protein [unclassified Janthinobacterium]|uniref:DUF4431 domain-containing protein n=1 Tax=unclassified Janthinobacterium TaxID=2610881 RepID=UPI001608F024|nr:MULTISPECIES: DUF4431 domain-containing protein [unclassified Janthinobacterium]MBB5368240.1 hypothetical protein [Janthinobacterium sp. K2C7]MBB5382223.1 hypothetical protein [Janthinobacterium sp. K2Li3]MBB5386622.1 hypothetical protein [Janthinobacterium sp. K2E3]
MRTVLKIASIALCSFSYMTVNAACLKYEPEEVTLAGKLHRETFPGSPNFESVADGDERETGFYLTLAQPICTQADSGSDRQAHESVREVQLVLSKEQYASLRPQLGQQLKLRGQLFSSFTGHHHADVLLRVDP